MLFLNTLDVEAAAQSFSFSTTFYPNVSQENTFGSISGGGGYITNGTGSISSNSGQVLTNIHNGYSYHVSIPFLYRCNWSDIGGTSFNTEADKYFTFWFNSVSISNTSGTVSNKKIYLDDDNYLIWDSSYSRHFYIFGGQMRGLANDVSIPFRLEYDVAFESHQSVGVSSTSLDSFTSTMNVSLNLQGRHSTDSEINSSRIQVQESHSSEISQSSQSTASNTGGILSKITEFFGSFFSNLIGIFVPEDGYFSDWFTRLNDLLAQKLGMLYAPFDLLIQVLTSILNADDSFAGIPFPGIEWDGQYLIEPFTFNFSSLGDVYTDLQGYVYFGTDVILSCNKPKKASNKITSVPK